MSDVLAMLTSAAYLPFSVALLLMLLIGAVEAIGLGSAAVDIDVGLDADGAGHWLGWLGIGRVPVLVVIIVFLALFGLAGVTLQQLLTGLAGSPLSPLAASAAAALAALPVTGVAARGLGRILPRDETSAIPLDALTGRIGTITLGEARHGSPARARVEDRHGQAHYVMVVPDNHDQIFREGQQVLLVHRTAELFHGIAYDNPLLPRLD